MESPKKVKVYIVVKSNIFIQRFSLKILEPKKIFVFIWFRQLLIIVVGKTYFGNKKIFVFIWIRQLTYHWD